MRTSDLVTGIVFFARNPFPAMIRTFLHFLTHTKPHRLILISDQNITEDHLTRGSKSLVYLGIIGSINIPDDTKNALFDVCNPNLIVFLTKISNIVTDDSLTGDHRSRRLAASRRESTRKVADPIIRTVSTHNEHMLGKPAFLCSLLNSKTQSKLLQTNCITGILSVSRVNLVLFQIHINATLIDIDRNKVFSFPFSMHKLKEVFAIADPLELLVTGTIKNRLAVDNIRRVSYLNA